MEAEELRIGDWVRISHLNKVGRVYRIDRANGKGNGFVAVIDGDFDEDCIEPIPLTAEILEKNGFVLIDEKDKYYRWEYAEGVYVNANFKSEEPWVEISDKGYYAAPECRFVHQFQHALRLCGIKKEMVI